MRHTDKPYVQLDHDQVSGCAVQTWKGYFQETEYCEAMRGCLLLLHETGADTLILNLQDAASSEWLDHPWTASEWLPDLLETDIRRLAVVVPGPVPTDCAFRYMPAPDRLVTACFFDRLEDARSWALQGGGAS